MTGTNLKVGTAMYLALGTLDGSRDYSLVVFILMWLSSWVGSSVLAGKRGYNPAVYGLIGFIMGPAGFLLTLVATRPTKGNGQAREVLKEIIFTGANGKQGEEAIKSILRETFNADTTLDQFVSQQFPQFKSLLERAKDSDNLAAFCNGLHDFLRFEEDIERFKGLCLAILSFLIGGMTILTWVIFVYVFPIYISFIEGMNLWLSLPTKMLILFTKVIRHPICAIPLPFILTFIPALIYYTGRYTVSFNTPLIGKLKYRIDLTSLLIGLKMTISSGLKSNKALLKALELTANRFSIRQEEKGENNEETIGMRDIVKILPEFPGHIALTLEAVESEKELIRILQLICNEEERKTRIALCQNTLLFILGILIMAVFLSCTIIVTVGLSFYQ